MLELSLFLGCLIHCLMTFAWAWKPTGTEESMFLQQMKETLLRLQRVITSLPILFPLYICKTREWAIHSTHLFLTDRSVYSIPLVLLIGWRGDPESGDWPQHERQGNLPILLDALNPL